MVEREGLFADPNQPDDKVRRFMLLYSANTRRIYGYILCSVPNWAEADDLLQDTCTILWSKFDEFEPGTDFVSWALRTAHFVIANYHRKQKVRRKYTSLNPELVESINRTAEAVGVFHQDHRIEALQRCLERLKGRDRALIRSRYETGNSVRKIAYSIGRKIDTVYKSLSRIHFQLLNCIERCLHVEDL